MSTVQTTSIKHNASTSNNIVLDSSGRVGIGTASPAQTLHVVGSDGVTIARIAGATFAMRVVSSPGVGTFVEATNNTEATYQPLLVGGSQLQFTTFGAERARITGAGDFQFNNGYGSIATAFGCRAWVRFNGTGTIAINGSGNVSSIGDINVGLYRVNFASAMPDANYSPQVSVGPDVNNGANGYVANFQLGSVDVYYILPGTAFYDNSNMQVAVFR